MRSPTELAEVFRGTAIDREFITQDVLNISDKRRMSLFPWRGQFSPDFVAAIIDAYTSSGGYIIDPFMGSGTTLYEAVRAGCSSAGSEVNYAAYAFARVVEYCSVSPSARRAALDVADTTVASLSLRACFDIEGLQAAMSSNPKQERLLAAAMLLAMGSERELLSVQMQEAMQRMRSIVLALPTTHKGCSAKAWQCDARDLPLEDRVADMVLTSPPYINVFNYHQHGRPAAELAGTDVLLAARSEIGSNRKHRGNRLFTVVQYCMDMSAALVEMHRVLADDGKAILIVGRESRVRGIPFLNGELIAMAAVGSGGFELCRRQERQFTSRFGQSIIEDILTLEVRPSSIGREAAEELGRDIGCWALERALADITQLEPGVVIDLEAAVERVPLIEASPLFRNQ